LIWLCNKVHADPRHWKTGIYIFQITPPPPWGEEKYEENNASCKKQEKEEEKEKKADEHNVFPLLSSNYVDFRKVLKRGKIYTFFFF